jgi:hypothetical protein
MAEQQNTFPILSPTEYPFSLVVYGAGHVTKNQSWAQLPLSVVKFVIRCSVGQRNNGYVSVLKFQRNEPTLI